MQMVHNGYRPGRHERRAAGPAGLALQAGLSRVKEIAASLVVVKEEVVKSGCAACPWYGKNLMCPPNVPPPAEFKKLLAAYSSGLLVQLFTPVDTGLPQDVLQRKTFEWARRFQILIWEVEERIKEAGFKQARGFAGGRCCLCEECAGPGGSCRHPRAARSSLEANGVDVVATCEQIGWEISFPVREKVSWTGLILLV